MKVSEQLAALIEAGRRGLLADAQVRSLSRAIATGQSQLHELLIDSGLLSDDEFRSVVESARPVVTDRPPRGKSGHDTSVQVASVGDTHVDTSHPVFGATLSPSLIAPVPGDSPTEHGATGAAVSPWEDSPDQLDSRYQRTSLLGVGGVGEVREAYDPVLQRRVAVKYARDRKSDGDGIIRREAEILARLEHPNIVSLYDAGTSKSKGSYYVMRLLEEQTLEEFLDLVRVTKTRSQRETLTKRLLRIFIQVCRAAEYAHRQGVVHCDLKPQNILIGNYGEVLIADWGLAWDNQSPTSVCGGTPGYMAPEQVFGGEIQPKTDVFALGAILYEIVALRPAFRSNSEFDTLVEAYRNIPPPSEVSSGREVPRELDEICMRALQTEIGERYPTSAALADDVEDFLEGRKELERRAIEAADQYAVAQELAAQYIELSATRPERMRWIREKQHATSPWASAEDKAELWDAQDALRVTDSIAAKCLQAAIDGFERTLELCPEHEKARQSLRGLYQRELDRARLEGDSFDQIHYARRLQAWTGAEDSVSTGKVVIDNPHELELGLFAIEEQGLKLALANERRLLGQRFELTLDTGDHLIQVASDTRVPTRHMFRVRASHETHLRIDPPRQGDVLEDEVYIPEGSALLGDQNQTWGVSSLEPVDVPAFIIQRYPVTFRDYLRFVAELLRTDPDRARLALPRGEHGGTYWEQVDGKWRAIRELFAGCIDHSPLDLPVFGVSAEDAVAYARWLSARAGLLFRLPSEIEWEKAARGTDGRLFPWGNRFDPSMCKMRFSRPGKPLPEPCGAFADDVSPFGVHDLGGGVADWVAPSGSVMSHEGLGADAAYSRGGAWCDWPNDCLSTVPKAHMRTERSARIGFRLARTPGRTVGEGPRRESELESKPQ